MNAHQSARKALVLALGGSGMNVLAQHLLTLGWQVTGMDRAFDRGQNTALRESLQAMGITILPENRVADLSPQDLVLTSPAVEEGHPALTWAVKNNTPVRRRSAYLKDFFNGSTGIAVTGTSGKTTVTGMTAAILRHAGHTPWVFCGAPVLQFQAPGRPGNYLPGEGGQVLLELDESEISFAEFEPHLLGITNLQRDHHPLSTLRPLFARLARQSGRVLISRDCPNLRDCMDEARLPCRTLSAFSRDADYQIRVDASRSVGIQFQINGHAGRLRIPGWVNGWNAAFAAALAAEAGIPLDVSLEALASFEGIQNRFELVPHRGGYLVLDFAHNPEKIRLCLQSAQALGYPVHFIFQPHGFGPFRFMASDLAAVFRETLRDEDRLYLLPVYDAGGTADRSIQSNALLNQLGGVQAVYLAQRGDLPLCREPALWQGQTWVVAGARDPTLGDFARSLVSGGRE